MAEAHERMPAILMNKTMISGLIRELPIPNEWLTASGPLIRN